MKYVMRDVVIKVEERIARRWVRGTGKDAEFEDGSEGWYAVFRSCPASMHLGSDVPTLKAGDRVRLTLEKE
jgi:hypothetical protein